MGVCITKPGQVLVTVLAADESSFPEACSDVSNIAESHSCCRDPVINVDPPVYFHPDVLESVQERNCLKMVQNMKPCLSQDSGLSSSENLMDYLEEKGILAVIRSNVLSISALHMASVKDLAYNLTHDNSKYLQELSGRFCTTVAKAYAIYLWITSNIQFDAENAKPAAQDWNHFILENRKGSSYDYASLFSVVCAEAGLNTEKIEGHLRSWMSLTGHEFCPDDTNYHCWNIVKTESRAILVDCTLGSRCGSSNHYFMPPPEHLILTHWPLDPSKQFLQSPLLLKELQQIVPVPITTRCLGLHPFSWSEIISVSKASPDPVAAVSFSLTDATASYVTAKLVPQSCSQEVGDRDNHTFVTKVDPNEFNVQAVLPTSGKFILNIYLNEIQGNRSNHLCLSYIIESEIHYDARAGYPYIYHLPAKAFDFTPRYWNTGNKAYNCVNSNAEFSLVFEAGSDVSFYHCLIRGRTTGPNESNPSDVYHHQTLLVNDNRNLYKLLAIFPDEHWWTIYISGTRTIEGTTSGYTSLLTYHVFAEKGSRKLSFPQTIMPGTVFFSCNPITATQILTTVPFATSKHLTFYHYLTLGQPGNEIHEGYGNIELDEEHMRNNQGCIHYLLNIVFPKAGTWFVHVYNTQSNGVNEGLFKLRITVDDPKLNTYLLQSNISLLKEFDISLMNNGIVTFTDDGQPFSFEFTAISDVDLLHELKTPDNSPVDYCTYLTRQHNTHQLSTSYTLSAIFPTPGKWTIELFASKAGNSSYELVLNLKLDVTTPVLDHCYPKIYPAFSDFGCQLLNNALLKSSYDSGEFKLPFQVSSAVYFFFKLENERYEDFSQQAFVHASPDSQEKLLHLIFPECGHWKLSMYANRLQKPSEQSDTTDQVLQISVQSNACIRDAAFPLLYKQFYEPFRLYFDPKDLPLPSVIKASKHPQRFSISYYSPPDVIFLHYAELRMQDREQSAEDLKIGGEVTEHVQTRMVSNSSTGLHHLQVEVTKTGNWTVLLYASSTDVPESPEKWIPVMRYVFSAITDL